MRQFCTFLLSVLLYVEVKSELFQPGNQWNYSYYALLRSGSLIPTEAYSQWDLRALLTITAAEGLVIAQLSNLNTSLYNGPRDGIPENLHPAPLPEKALYLGTPFIIHYTGTHVDSISVDRNDPLWTVNIKRAIASIFQLDFNKFNTPASFTSEESIYGSCSGIEYSVVNNTEYVYVRKVIDTTQCKGSPGREWSSATKFPCGGVNEDPISASTSREYTLARGEGTYELKHVLSTRRLYVQPFQAYGEAQQTYQYQVFQLLSTSIAPETYGIPTHLVRTSLTYVQNFTDLTHGRISTTFQKNIADEVNTLLDKVVDNLEEQNLNQNIVQLHKELMLIYYSLFLLNSQSLRTLYSDIAIGTSYQQETKRNIFLEILPQAGSDESVNFMKDLIVKRELKDLISIKMLSMYPFYVKQHSEKLLNDMSVLLTLGDNYNSKIRHTAILSFATLVYQTYVAGECSLETLENYGIKYFNWFSESSSYEKRMLYLQGLDNLQLGSVANYLTSVIENNEQSRHIRFLAVWASMFSAPSRPQQVYATHWPIFIDRTQHLEMRVAALTMLLIAQPTRTRLLTLFWYMQAGTDPHIYSFFYTTLISLQKTQYPCYKHLGKLASQVIRFLRPPRNKQQWTTGNYILDYVDNERAFGGIIQLFLIGNPVTDSPNVIYLTINNYATEKNLNQIGVYLKLQGVADHLRETINSEIIDTENIEKLTKLLEKFNVNLVSPEEIHIELIVKIQGKSAFCYHIDGKNFKTFSRELLHLKMLLEYHVNYQSIVVPYTREHMEPSDIGTLVIRAIVSNSIASTRGNFMTRTSSEMHTHNFAVDFRYYTYTTSFLEVYNPFSHIWHGVEKGKKLQARFLFNGTINIDVAKSVVELSEVRTGNEYISVVIHSQSYTYLVSNGTGNILQQHCPNCMNIFNINSRTKRENVHLIDMPFENFGNKFQLNIFDCESYQDLKKIFLDVFMSHQSNTQILPVAKPIMYGIHFADYISYIPSHGSCGVSINLKPLYKEPTQLTITYAMPHYSNLTSLDQSQSGTKITALLTLAHKKLPDGPNLQFWNASLVGFIQPIKRFTNITLTVANENVTGEHQKLCVSAELHFPDIQPDMFSIKPSKPTTANFKAVWGSHQKNSDTCPAEAASIEAVATASVTEEQKQIALTSDQWPYKECRNSIAGHKYTPISLPCYRASKEAATYRKYTTDIKFSNMPEWFIALAQKLQSLIGVIQKHSTQNDLIGKSSKTTNVKIVVEFSASEPIATVKWNTKEAVIYYSGFEFVDKFLVNPRFLIQDDWNINLGLFKVCLVTPSAITTVDNRTIQVDEIKLRKKDTLLTADCSNYPKFAMFLDGSTNFEELAFTAYAGGDTLTIQPKEKKISVMLNGQEFNTDIIKQHISVRRLQDDVLLTHTKYGGFGIDIYYTKEYMVITIPGFYTGKICGVCNSIKNYLP